MKVTQYNAIQYVIHEYHWFRCHLASWKLKFFYADLERMITRKWTVECEPHQNNKKPVQKKTMSQVNHLYFSMLSN